MKANDEVAVRRRHLLGITIVGLAAATTGAVVDHRAAVKRHDPTDERKTRFQTNSPEVRNFYRVNSYPRT
jgi:hypothetical protein